MLVMILSASLAMLKLGPTPSSAIGASCAVPAFGCPCSPLYYGAVFTGPGLQHHIGVRCADCIEGGEMASKENSAQDPLTIRDTRTGKVA